MSSMLPGMAFVLGCAAVVLLSATAGGDPPKAAPDAPEPHASVVLISEGDTFLPGSTAMLGLTFTIEKDWHLYWNGRNDTGLPPSAEFTLPEGFTVGEWQWPAPIRHVLPGDILDHVYEQRVTLLIPVHVSAEAKASPKATVTAKVEWLVCNEACVPESAEVSLTLPVGPSTATAKRWPDTKQIAEARSRLPMPLPANSGIASITWSKDAAKINVPGAAGLAFFPAADCIELSHAIPDTATTGDNLTMRVQHGDEAALRGVLEVRRPGKATVYYSIDSRATLPASPEALSPKTPNQETQAPTIERR